MADGWRGSAWWTSEYLVGSRSKDDWVGGGIVHRGGGGGGGAGSVIGLERH